MTQQFKQGDHVQWNTPQGKTTGVVQQKITADTHAGGRKVAASEDSPQYLVKSDKTGKEAVHKPDSLEAVS
jgi:hypothetical protein